MLLLRLKTIISMSKCLLSNNGKLLASGHRSSIMVILFRPVTKGLVIADSSALLRIAWWSVGSEQHTKCKRRKFLVGAESYHMTCEVLSPLLLIDILVRMLDGYSLAPSGCVSFITRSALSVMSTSVYHTTDRTKSSGWA